MSLEPLSLHHARAMLLWLKDPIVADGLGLTRKPSIKYTLEWIDRSISDSSIDAFAVLFNGSHVGNVILDQIDHTEGTARFSIYLGERASRGMGIGRRATSMIVEHAFGDLRLRRVWLHVHTDNAAAIRTYLACGFTVQTVLGGGLLIRGEPADAFLMTLESAAPVQ